MGSTVGVAISGSSSSGSRASGSSNVRRGTAGYLQRNEVEVEKAVLVGQNINGIMGELYINIRRKREGARCIHTINITPRARFNDSQPCRAVRHQE